MSEGSKIDGGSPAGASTDSFAGYLPCDLDPRLARSWVTAS